MTNLGTSVPREMKASRYLCLHSVFLLERVPDVCCGQCAFAEDDGPRAREIDDRRRVRHEIGCERDARIDDEIDIFRTRSELRHDGCDVIVRRLASDIGTRRGDWFAESGEQGLTQCVVRNTKAK